VPRQQRPGARPPLTAAQILAWADAYHARTGRWPRAESGAILDAPGENWHAVNHALARGYRGLPGGSSLSQFLAAERGKPHKFRQPPLTVKQILAWADAHFDLAGEWPKAPSGPVAGAPGETWRAIDEALRRGHRGLPGDSSLSWLLTHHGRGG
jgi:hypothetical protein